jgi:hypothetical protein
VHCACLCAVTVVCRVSRVSDAFLSCAQLADRSEIHTRYFCSADPVKPREEWKLLPQDFPNTVPTMTVRNKCVPRLPTATRALLCHHRST